MEKRIYDNVEGDVMPITTTINGERPTKPNPDIFFNTYGVYEVGELGHKPLLFITSRRDKYAHKTLWGLMDLEGTLYWVDCLKVKLYKKED